MGRIRVDGLLDLLFPPRCVLCGQPVVPLAAPAPRQPVCPGCTADLPWLEDPERRLPWPAGSPAVAPDVVPGALVAWSALNYEYPADRLVALAKFGRRLPVARALGELLALRCPELPAPPEAVVPVPLHWRREAWRGFNQAEEIARVLCAAQGWLLRPDLCRRRRPTPAQSGLGAGARRLNLDEAFALRKGARLARFRHVLVVDDVLTTGATGLAVAGLFRSAGVPDVRLWTVARAPPPGLPAGSGQAATRNV